MAEIKGQKQGIYLKFPNIASKTFRRNLIVQINHGGRMLSDPGDIKEVVFNHFKNLYTESMPKLRGLFHTRVNYEDKARLKSKFSEEERIQVIKDCDPGRF